MCLYVLALGLLYRIFDLISRPNFDTAVFFTARNVLYI